MGRREIEIYGQRSLVRFFGAPWTLLVRVPLLINFMLLFSLLSPLGTSRKLYKAERAAGIAASITLTLQVWVIGTTLFATAVFVWARIKRSDPVTGKRWKPAKFDWGLLVFWWILIVLLCLFAFMMGMGG
jgi:hypothetical protein